MNLFFASFPIFHMSFQMGPQRASFFETLSALVAFKRPLSSVITHVDLQSTSSHKSLIAERARKRLRITMTPEMIYQVTLRAESFTTPFESAEIRLLACMGAHMSFHIALL